MYPEQLDPEQLYPEQLDPEQLDPEQLDPERSRRIQLSFLGHTSASLSGPNLVKMTFRNGLNYGYSQRLKKTNN